MDCRVVITAAAIRDLSEIVRFIAADNPEAAGRTGRLLYGKAQLLAQFPEMGRRLPEAGFEHLRELIVRPYRVVYRFDAEQKLVEVWRFWHGARGTPVIIEQE